MKNSHKFFSNKECKYYPCHELQAEYDFNCLLCYCPLYLLDDKCGGDFKYDSDGVKNCDDCNRPHRPEYYDTVVSILKKRK